MAEVFKKTISGVIRSRLALYEARLYNGETANALIYELASEGYPLSKGSFYVLFHRAKKRAAASDSSLKAVSISQTKESFKELTELKKIPSKTPNSIALPVAKKKPGFDIQTMNSYTHEDLY